MNEISERFAQALQEQYLAALTAMRKKDCTATTTMLNRVEAGEARLMVVCELVPEFFFKLVYIGPDGIGGDVFSLTGKKEVH